MDIRKYLELYTFSVRGSEVSHLTEDGAILYDYEWDKEINIDGVVPFSLAEVVVEMAHMSLDEAGKSGDDEPHFVNFYISENLKLKASAPSQVIELDYYGETETIYSILLGFRELHGFFEAIEYNNDEDHNAIEIFNQNFKTPKDIPEEELAKLFEKFDPSKFSRTIGPREEYLELFANKVKEQFEDFDITDPYFNFIQTRQGSQFVVELENKKGENWNYEKIAKIFSSLSGKVESLFLETPMNVDLIYYQLIREDIYQYVSVETEDNLIFRISLTITFDIYSNEDFYREFGPGYYLTLLDNICAGRFDREALTVLLEYTKVPYSQDLSKLCSALRVKVAHFSREDFEELANLEETEGNEIQLRSSMLTRNGGL